MKLEVDDAMIRRFDKAAKKVGKNSPLYQDPDWKDVVRAGLEAAFKRPKVRSRPRTVANAKRALALRDGGRSLDAIAMELGGITKQRACQLVKHGRRLKKAA